MVGPTLRSSLDVGNVELGHQFNWGGGFGYLIGDNTDEVPTRGIWRHYRSMMEAK